MKNLIENAKKLGLNTYESSAYISLLSLGSSQASAVSRKANVPRARIYDVLLSLQKKGLVVQRPVKPVEYSALPLESAFELMKEKKEKELEAHVKELSSVFESLKNEAMTLGSSASSDSVFLVEGRKNIYSLMSKNALSPMVVGSADSLERKKSFFNEKKIPVKLVENNSARHVVLSDEKIMLFLCEGENEETEKALFITSPFLAKSLKETAMK
jgi:predicted transcriptional regulator